MSWAIITPTVGNVLHNVKSWATVPVIEGGINPHDRSRGYLAAKALADTDAELFLWVDNDNIVQPDQARHLIQSAREHDADIMAGVYVCRHAAANGKIALSFTPEPNPGDDPAQRIAFGQDGKVMKIVACGFGVVVTHRRIFSHPIAPEVDYTDWDERTVSGRAWFLPVVRGRSHLGEDRSFCTRLREQTRARMFVDTRIVVEHRGYHLADLVPAEGI